MTSADIIHCYVSLSIMNIGILVEQDDPVSVVVPLSFSYSLLVKLESIACSFYYERHGIVTDGH